MVIRTNIYIYISILTHAYYHDLLNVREAVFFEEVDDLVRELECLIVAAVLPKKAVERSYDVHVARRPRQHGPLQAR